MFLEKYSNFFLRLYLGYVQVKGTFFSEIDQLRVIRPRCAIFYRSGDKLAYVNHCIVKGEIVPLTGLAAIFQSTPEEEQSRSAGCLRRRWRIQHRQQLRGVLLEDER